MVQGRGGRQVTGPARIPLLVPDLPPLEALLPRLAHIYTTKRATNFGGLVTELEQRLSDRLGCYVVTTANATLALELALTVLELPKGSTVACPALTFPATITAILRASHVPRFVDVDSLTWCAAANEFGFSGGKDFARVAVSAFGAGLSASQIGGTWINTIIDAAPAWGNQEALKGAITCYSLHATKALIAGEGGAIAVHDQALAKCVRALTNFGIGTMLVGTNAKMSEYHAAVALASLDTWEERSELRRNAEKFYFQALDSAVPYIDWQEWDCAWTRTIFPVLLPEGADVERVMANMDAAGIDTRRWYYPLVCDRYSGGQPLALPVSRAISKRLLGLPFFTGITHAQMERVAKELRAALAPNV